MQKTLEKYRSKKKNGGFTLVELIIVIAIMAALVAILAPQYMQYVEKSRVTADESTADQLLSSCKVAAADTDATWTKGATTTVTWSSGTIAVSNSADKETVKTSLAKSLGITFASGSDSAPTDSTIKSSKHKNQAYTVTIIIDANGEAKVTGTWPST